MFRRQPKDASGRFDIRFDASKPFDVVGFGTNSVDHLCVVPRYPDFDTKTEVLRYELQTGGPVATAVAALARMGLRTKYIGKVGSDDFGRIQLESLNGEGTDTSAVLVAPNARSQFAFIVIEEAGGERTIIWQRDKRLNFGQHELCRADVCAGRVLHLDGHDPAAVRAAGWARAEGIPVIIDIDGIVAGSERLIASVDFLIASMRFALEFTSATDPCEALRTFNQYGPCFAAITMGAQGAMALIDDECIQFPAYAVDAVDTTGAGDVFHAGFIYGLLQNWPLDQIMRFANAAAGLSCTRLGARAGLPSLRDVMRLAGIPPA